MHDFILCKSGKGIDHWCSLTTGQWGQILVWTMYGDHCIICTEALHGASVQCRLALSDPVLLFPESKVTPGRPVPSLQDWPELIKCVNTPWEGSNYFWVLHVMKTTCDLDKSGSPFRECVITLKGSLWLVNKWSVADLGDMGAMVPPSQLRTISYTPLFSKKKTHKNWEKCNCHVSYFYFYFNSTIILFGLWSYCKLVSVE